MKRTLVLLIFCVLMIGLWSGCAKRQTVWSPLAPAGEPGEKLIWASHHSRPRWTIENPETVTGELAFVGLSGEYATEKEAREDAMRTARNHVVGYIGTLAQDRFELLQTSYGLSTEIVDPTNVTRRFQEQLASAFVSRLSPKQWYIEKWLRKKEKKTYVLAFVLAKVPKSMVDKAYEDTINATIDDLKKKRDESSEAEAKEQFEDAMKAFEEAKKQGFSLEK